jgi:chromosome segregation ATPase
LRDGNLKNDKMWDKVTEVHNRFGAIQDRLTEIADRLTIIATEQSTRQTSIDNDSRDHAAKLASIKADQAEVERIDKDLKDKKMSLKEARKTHQSELERAHEEVDSNNPQVRDAALCVIEDYEPGDRQTKLAISQTISTLAGEISQLRARRQSLETTLPTDQILLSVLATNLRRLHQEYDALKDEKYRLHFEKKGLVERLDHITQRMEALGHLAGGPPTAEAQP